jgi:hypothetical protein
MRYRGNCAESLPSLQGNVRDDRRYEHRSDSPRQSLDQSAGRTTFVIDSQGRICDVYDSVMNFFAHSKFVSKALEKLALQESQKTETD